MIRIRYRDFSAGTHDFTGLRGVARQDGRGVTVYLIPGLTAGERRAVLRRLRQEASRGFGPPLPLFAFAFALCADRVRTATGTGVAIIRLHPAVTLVPGALVAAVMALFIFASAGRPVDFTPGPQVHGLALSPGAGAGQIGGRRQASPGQDRRLFAIDSLGPARGDGGGQPLGLGNPAHGKDSHGEAAKGEAAKGKAEGRSKTKSGNGGNGGSRGSGNGNSGNGNGSKGNGSKGNGKGDGRAARGPRRLTSERSADVPRSPRDRPPAAPPGLGTVKGGVGVGHHRR